MSRTITRRGLVQGAGAAIGATAAGMPASALAETQIPASDLDAEWHALLDRRRETLAAWQATDAPATDAHARAKAAYPEMPRALRPVFSDISSGVALVRADHGREQGPDGRIRGFYTRDDVEALRAAGPITTADDWDDDGNPRPATLNLAGEARRLEIVAAHDRWTADRRAIEHAVGYTAACEAEEAAGLVYYEADEAVEAYQPRTIAGLVAKGAWVAERLRDPGFTGDLAEVFARQVAAFGEVMS